MAKFVKHGGVTPVLLVLLLAVVSGCARVQVPNYIKADHPYTKNLYGDYDRIVAVVRHVLDKNGWGIQSVSRPSEYERPAEGTESNKDLLIFTEVKQHSMVLYSSYTHLNVFIHPIADGANVEIRYAKQTPLLVKQFYGSRNDAMVHRLLQHMETELVEKP